MAVPPFLASLSTGLNTCHPPQACVVSDRSSSLLFTSSTLRQVKSLPLQIACPLHPLLGLRCNYPSSSPFYQTIPGFARCLARDLEDHRSLHRSFRRHPSHAGSLERVRRTSSAPSVWEQTTHPNRTPQYTRKHTTYRWRLLRYTRAGFRSTPRRYSRHSLSYPSHVSLPKSLAASQWRLVFERSNR